MHSFVLRLRRGVGGGSTTKSDVTDDRGIAEKSDGEATGIQSQSYARGRWTPSAPARRRRFRHRQRGVSPRGPRGLELARGDRGDSTRGGHEPAADAAQGDHARGGQRAIGRPRDERGPRRRGEDVAARLAATATTPRKDPAVASPNPFVNEREDSFFETPETSTKGEQHEGHGFGEPSARSPDARAIPLPSPGLLSRPGSSEHRLRRVASRYDPNGAASDEDGPGRVSRALAFEQEKTSDGPGRVVDSHEKSRDVDRANRGARPPRPVAEDGIRDLERVGKRARTVSVGERPRVRRSSERARDSRAPRASARYSSASSSPAMSAAAGGARRITRRSATETVRSRRIPLWRNAGSASRPNESV